MFHGCNAAMFHDMKHEYRPTVLCTILLTLFFHVEYAIGSSPCIPKPYNKEGTVCVCNATYCDFVDDPEPLTSGHYHLFVSSKAGLRLNQTYGSFTTKLFTNEVDCPLGLRFKVNTSNSYQTMKGFGGAFTDAACLNILSLSKEAQDKLLSSYFSQNGIKYNIGKIPVGGTDFSTRVYTYADVEADPVLSNFELVEEDVKFKIPVITRALNMSKEQILVFGSAWSPPVYMKTNKRISGIGFLLDKYYSAWADYHIKFLDAYRNHSINFWALTTGNEPIDGVVPAIVTFNSLGWFPWTHRKWVSQFLGPKLEQSQHNKTILIGFDDQRLLLPGWMKVVFNDAGANRYIKGIGVHWYLDLFTPVSILDNTHRAFPDKFIIYTEACLGSMPWSRGVKLGYWSRGEDYMHSLISTANNWVSAWTDWNLALDEHGGPNWDKNYVDSPIIVNSTSDEFYKQPHFYSMAHFSKFVHRGAVRIGIVPEVSGNVEATAFLNPNGEVVVVFYNKESKLQNITLEDVHSNSCILLQLPQKSFATLIYKT